MSGNSELRRRQAEIAAYIETAELDLQVARHLAEQVPEFLARARQDAARDSNVGLFASAKLLADLYTSVEVILERTETVFATVPSTKEWHRDLLRGMANRVPGFRPQVLQSDTVARLEEFLRFRHFERHAAYRQTILFDRIEALAGTAQPLMQALETDLAGFWRYARQCIQELQHGSDADPLPET